MGKGRDKKLRQGTYKQMVMRELFFCKLVRKQLLIGGSDDSYGYKYKSRQLVSLVSDGYIGQVVQRKHTYCYLTNKGFRFLAECEPKYKQDKKIIAEQKYVKGKFNSDVSRAETMFCLERFGMGTKVFPDETIPFQELLRVRRPEIPEMKNCFQTESNGSPTNEEIIELLEKGVFYSSSELKRTAKLFDRNSDDFKFTRFTGILIHHRKMYVTYDMMNRMLKWKESCEDAGIDAIRGMLTDYEGTIDIREEDAEAILIGQRLSDVKRLVWGNAKREPTAEDMAKIRFLSSELLWAGNTKLYQKIYYMPTEHYGMLREQERMWNDILNVGYINHQMETLFGKNGWMLMQEPGKDSEGIDLYECEICRITSLEIMKLRRMMAKSSFILLTLEDYVPVLQELFGNRIESIYCFEEEEGEIDYTKVKRYEPEIQG